MRCQGCGSKDIDCWRAHPVNEDGFVDDEADEMMEHYYQCRGCGEREDEIEDLAALE